MVQPGLTYAITGTQFNGLSQAVGFGDDFQAATNYPQVRITNTTDGKIFFRDQNCAQRSIFFMTAPPAGKLPVIRDYVNSRQGKSGSGGDRRARDEYFGVSLDVLTRPR